jgi:hypothetical protein
MLPHPDEGLEIMYEILRAYLFLQCYESIKVFFSSSSTILAINKINKEFIFGRKVHSDLKQNNKIGFKTTTKYALLHLTTI